MNQIGVLTSAKLIKISKNYHNLSCPDEECIEYAKTEKKVKIYKGIGAEIQYSQLLINEYIIPVPYFFGETCESKKSVNYTINLPVEFQMLNFSRKLSFEICPGFSTLNYTANKSKYSSTNTYHQFDTKFNISAVNLPIMLKYSFNSNTWKVWPTLGLGFSFSYFLSQKAEFTTTNIYYGEVYEYKSEEFEFSGYQNSIFISAGTDIPVSGKKISLFVKYSVGDGIHRLKYLDSFLKISKTNTLGLGINWMF